MNKPRTEELYKVRDSNVRKITVREKNYLRDETYINEWTYEYRTASTITGNLKKNGEHKSSFEYLINSDNRIIESKVVSYNRLIGNDKLHIKYDYSDTLKVMTFLDDNSSITSKILVNMDSLRSPVMISNYDSNGVLHSKETADYDYSSSTYRYKVYNASNGLVLDELSYYNHEFVIEINEHGDITKLIWPLSKNKSITSYEYKYDKGGNWVSRTKRTVQDNKSMIASIVTRKIVYL